MNKEDVFALKIISFAYSYLTIIHIILGNFYTRYTFDLKIALNVKCIYYINIYLFIFFAINLHLLSMLLYPFIITRTSCLTRIAYQNQC